MHSRGGGVNEWVEDICLRGQLLSLSLRASERHFIIPINCHPLITQVAAFSFVLLLPLSISLDVAAVAVRPQINCVKLNT